MSAAGLLGPNLVINKSLSISLSICLVKILLVFICQSCLEEFVGLLRFAVLEERGELAVAVALERLHHVLQLHTVHLEPCRKRRIHPQC